jgi:hypothetical protein
MELTHAGPKDVDREAELRRPSGCVCSDFVELSRYAAMVFGHVEVGCRAASYGDFITLSVYAKYQFFIHRQH